MPRDTRPLEVCTLRSLLNELARLTVPRMRPKTFLQCFALEQWESEAKYCRNVLGRILGRKN